MDSARQQACYWFFLRHITGISCEDGSDGVRYGIESSSITIARRQESFQTSAMTPENDSEGSSKPLNQRETTSKLLSTGLNLNLIKESDLKDDSHFDIQSKVTICPTSSRSTTCNAAFKSKEHVADNQRERLAVFEEGEWNTYYEKITIAHIMYDEIQNLLLDLSDWTQLQLMNKSITALLLNRINIWESNPSLIFEEKNFVTVIQTFIGLSLVVITAESEERIMIKSTFRHLVISLNKYLEARSLSLMASLATHLDQTKFVLGFTD